MNYKEVVKEFENFKNTPKLKLKEVPAKFEYIIQLFTTKEQIGGGLLLNDSLLEKQEKRDIVQPYPYAVILKASEKGEYKEGQFVYLTDNILKTQENPEWLGWERKIENQHPTPYDPEPPRYIGGLNEIEQYRFKEDKLKVENDSDKFIYQIPERVIKGIYED